MGSTKDLSRGAYLKFNGELCQILEYQHTMPGKGGAFYQVKMKNIKTGKSVENRFRSGEAIDFIRIDDREMQYLYQDGQNLMCMDPESFEQIPVPKEYLGDTFNLIKEEMMLTISFQDGNVLFAKAPKNVELEVTYSEPGVKGDTATNATKPATLETGAVVNVPLFINVGDILKIDTESCSYMERVKK